MNKVQEFVGRRLGEVWLTGWGIAGAVCVGYIIWRWG